MKDLTSFLPLALCAFAHSAMAQHSHLDAGALDPTQNSPLIWANAGDFAAPSGYVKTLHFADSGRFAGYFEGGITPTALPATEPFAGPHPDAAALGSFLAFQISCLEAPEGAQFGFWEAGSTEPALSLSSGESSPVTWPLSESDGSASSDPYGHIHGRRFTATKPGFYKVGLTVVDTSTNGTAGGPIHSPSEELEIWFQAGVAIQSIQLDPGSGQVRVRFGAASGFVWQVEMKTSLEDALAWEPVGFQVPGDDHFAEIVHSLPEADTRFYRLSGIAVAP